MEELDGKVALVTGGASGIGRAIVRRFAAAGARVATLDLIATEEGDARLIADLGDDESVGSAIAHVARQLGTPDVVVHAAAQSVPGSILDTQTADFARLYDVNVVGAVRLLQGCAPAMMGRGHGAFVLLSSINARFATPTLAAYAASKAALDNLTLTAALELAPHGVRVNAIAPASIDTPLLRGSFARQANPERARKDNVLRHPLGRLGSPEEVAELALFLASDRAGWITGTVQLIDGGAHVTRR